jgi:hypothetical protein
MLHRYSRLVPPKFRLAKGGLSSPRRVPSADDERDCAGDESSSAVQLPFVGHGGSM